MAQPSGQAAWILLPCILFSLFATRFLIEDFASPDERGLMMVAKAALILLTTLILTVMAVNSLFRPTPPPTRPPSRNVLHKKQKISPETEERILSWRESTVSNLRWSSDSSDEVKEEAKQWRRKKKKMSGEKRERLDEKSPRKRLSDMFKPKRYEMLGIRREDD